MTAQDTGLRHHLTSLGIQHYGATGGRTGVSPGGAIGLHDKS
jgi:hypothetical protein